MPAEPEALSATLRLQRAFAGLVAVERISRSLEALAIGASSAWIVLGLAELEGPAAGAAARIPAGVAGLLAAASWVIERWRGRPEIAARAERVLSTPQLFDTALGASAAPAGWAEMLARRALARFDRTRLWLAAAPAWTASAALLLLAAGTHELCLRCAPATPPSTPLTNAWNALAEGLEAGSDPAANSAASARSELATELRLAAGEESRGELGAEQARSLLGRAVERLEPELGPAGSRSAPESALASSLAELQGAYGRPPAAGEAGSQAGIAGTPTSGAGSGVPPGVGEGTMGGSTESGPVRLPAPPGAAVAGAEALVRPTLSARWWPRDSDALVEAWIERQQRTRSKR